MHRDQRGAPVLQEQEHDQDDQDHRLDERDGDLADAFGDGAGGVERVLEAQIRGEARFEEGHLLPHAVRDLQRVRAGRLEDRDRAAGLAVDAADLLVVQRPELDSGDVAQPDHRAVRVRADRNRPELRLGLKPPLRANGVGHVLTGRGRVGADLARRIHGALLLDRVPHVRHGQPEPGEQVRLDPYPHRVVAGAEDARLADAGHAIERVEDVDVGVVGQEQRVVGLVRRQQRHDQHRQAGLLAHGQAELADLGRQVGLRLGHAVLDVDLVDAWIRIDVERHGQRHRAVVGVGRLHVDHVVDAVHLLFERRRYRLFDGHRVRAGILRGDGDLRRDNRRELGDGEIVERDQPAQHGHDRDDDRDNRPADEEAGHVSGSPPAWD